MSREQHDQTAIRTHIGAIFVSLELSRSTWQVTSLSPGGGEKMSKHGVDADDVAGLLARFGELKRKAQARTGEAYRIIAIQEAGLDGFWIHRVLEREGVESHVVDAASVAVSRRRRRAKTDRIDGEALVRTLLAFKRGEPRVCAMVRPPTPEDEDRRRVCRERKTLIAERVRHVNRIKGLLHSQGVGDFKPLRRDQRRALEALRTGDGRSLGAHMKAQIGRELDRLEMLLDQIGAVEAEREAMLAAMDREQTAARAQTQLASQQARRDAWRRQAAPQARQEAPQGGAGETAPPGPAQAAPPSTIQMLTACAASARSSPPRWRPSCSAGPSTIAGKWALTPAWRRRRGRADRSTTNRACRRRAIRACERRWSSWPGCGCAINRLRRCRAGSRRGSPTARADANARSSRSRASCSSRCGNTSPPASSSRAP